MDDFIGGGGYNSGRQTQDQANAKKWMKIVGIILFRVYEEISRMKFVMKCSLTYLRQAVLH